MKDHLLTTLENSREYTLAVAEAMPEKEYDSKPADGIWNFRELLSHIAYGIHWWENNFIKRTETAWDPPLAKDTKQQVLSYINEAYASLKRTISNGQAADNVVKGFQATLDHITHHRGQAILYLRCKGIVPPEYKF